MVCTDRNKVLIVGAAILDVLVSPADPEVFSKGSYPAEDIRLSFGGDALNEATVLASLGKQVYLDTVIGNDTEGQMVADRCDKLGIRLLDHCRKDEIKTGVNVVLVQQNGERHFLTNKNGSLRKLTLDDIHMPFPEDAGIFCFASMFVSPKIGTPEMVRMFKAAKAQDMIVCADMTKRKNEETVNDISEALKYVDYLIPNEEEAYLVTGADTPKVAAELLYQAGVKHIVIKCGKRGCYLYDRNGGRYIPAVKGITCVDTTGAGDSFAAGFVYGLSEGWNIETCAEFANRCGAKAVAQVGATSWCQNKDAVD